MAEAKSKKENDQSSLAGRGLSALHESWIRPPAEDATLEDLRKQLGDCLEYLEKFVKRPYQNASSLDCWPTGRGLDQLTIIVERLGQSMGIRRIGFGCLGAVLRRIDRRWPKLGLVAFVNALLLKIKGVPVGPLTRIKQELAACGEPQRKGQLSAIGALLESREWGLPGRPEPWRELGPLLHRLSGGKINELIARAQPATMQEMDFHESRRIFEEVFSLAAFLEMQRQYLIWRLQWDDKVLPSARWIYGFQNHEWDTSLREVLIVSAPPPVVFAKHTKRFNETEKKRRSREKKRAGTAASSPSR